MKHLYVKKPIPVEAYQWDGSVPFLPAPEFEPKIEQESVTLQTAEGPMKIKIGSYILKGPAGEYWAVQEEFFLNTYDAIPQEGPNPVKFSYGGECIQKLQKEGKSYPKTCGRCKLGPCTEQFAKSRYGCG